MVKILSGLELINQNSEFPTLTEDTTRFPDFPWDLRTLIIIFPLESPFYFLNLNIVAGLTGTLFDQTEKLNGLGPHDVFDLQFCLEGKNKFLTYKNYHHIQTELQYQADKVNFQLGKQMEFTGSWPVYTINYQQQDLSLKLKFSSESNLHWWFKAPRLYNHYSSFGQAQLEWKWGDEAGEITVSGIHDHGWGRNFLPLTAPLKLFRYEILSLPVSGDYAISLYTKGPLQLDLLKTALLREEQQHQVMDNYEFQILEWEEFTNADGLSCSLPHRWLGKMRGQDGWFVYEALRQTEPRPVLGKGFLYGFKWQGEFFGKKRQKLEGQGYAEQMGDLLD